MYCLLVQQLEMAKSGGLTGILSSRPIEVSHAQTQTLECGDLEMLSSDERK